MKSFFLFGFFVTSPVLGAIAIPTQELVFPQLVVGGGWECDITLVAQGADWSEGTIFFLDENSNLMPVRVNGSSPKTSHDYQLLYRSAETFRISSPSGVLVGFAIVGQSTGTDAAGSVNGILTYRWEQSAQTQIQIGVLPSPSLSMMHIPLNNTGGNRTAFAVVALDRTPITLTRYNEAGNYQDQATLTFSGQVKRAAFFDEFFPASQNKRSFLKVSSTGTFQMLVLDQNGLILSTAAGLPGVIERQVTIRISDTTTWTLRLTQDGPFYYGLAELPAMSLLTFASGAIAANTLQLNIHCFLVTTGEALNICLLAGDTDFSVNGGSVVVVRENGTIWDTGTFDMFPSSSAQF